MVWTRLENGQHLNSSSGNTVGTERLQEKNRTTKEELGERYQARPLNMDLTWKEAEVLANGKAEWRRPVAHCSHLDAG